MDELYVSIVDLFTTGIGANQRDVLSYYVHPIPSLFVQYPSYVCDKADNPLKYTGSGVLVRRQGRR
jgi:hypothetical protein